jgi:hypothetical protein
MESFCVYPDIIWKARSEMKTDLFMIEVLSWKVKLRKESFVLKDSLSFGRKKEYETSSIIPIVFTGTVLPLVSVLH